LPRRRNRRVPPTRVSASNKSRSRWRRCQSTLPRNVHRLQYRAHVTVLLQRYSSVIARPLESAGGDQMLDVAGRDADHNMPKEHGVADTQVHAGTSPIWQHWHQCTHRLCVSLRLRQGREVPSLHTRWRWVRAVRVTFALSWGLPSFVRLWSPPNQHNHQQ